MDVTRCDLEIVDRAWAIAKRPGPRRERAMAVLIAVVFRLRVALGISRRGRSKLRFRAWGRWCGPNYGCGKPVDQLDAACQAHDNCYDQFD